MSKTTIRERILATVHGCTGVAVPFTIYRWLLPRGAGERELREMGLGMQVQHPVYRVDHPHVQTETRILEAHDERTIYKIYHTPIGDAQYVQQARRGEAYDVPWTIEPLLKTLRDYEIMRFVIGDAVITPNHDALRSLDEEVGEDGIVLGAVGLSPFQELVSPDWLGMDGTSYWLADHAAEFDDLYAALARNQQRIYEIAAEAPVELIHSDENVTALMVGPRLFQRYHLPFYERMVPQLHAAGKRFVAHFDGSIRPLKESLATSPIDVIEAFTPPPMGDLGVREAKAAWPGKVIWSNFPGSVFLEDEAGIRACVSGLLDEAAGGRFILGITEDIPEHLAIPGLKAIAMELKGH